MDLEHIKTIIVNYEKTQGKNVPVLWQFYNYHLSESQARDAASSPEEGVVAQLPVATALEMPG